MKSIKDMFFARSIRSKIFIIFAGGYIVVITIIGVLIYYTNVNNTKEKAYEMSTIFSDQVTQTLNLFIKDIERVSLALFTDSDVQEILTKYTDEQMIGIDLQTRNRLYSTMFNQVYPRKDIERITFYTRSDLAFTYQRNSNLQTMYNPVNEEWLKKLGDDNGFILLPAHHQINPQGKFVEVISLIKNIYEIPSMELIGTVKIDLKANNLHQLIELDKLNELKDYLRIFIIDDDREIVFDQKQDSTKQNVDTLFNLSLDSGLLNFDKKNHIYARTYSDYTNWQSIILIDEDFVYYERSQILLFIGITGFFAICVIATLAFTASNIIVKPLTNMIQKMRRVESGDLAERMELSNNEEIDIFIRVYNSMLDSLHRLITEVYELSIEEQNAKISVLQSQINPHFLYNTLNIMKSISRVKGNEEVAEISESLAELFKYSMKNMDRFVRLSDEINHIRNYIRIQQHRFHDRFTVAENISQQLNEYQVPKLILQPIVENAFNYGIETKKKDGLIEITAIRKKNQIMIRITDNGYGMSEEKLHDLQTSLQTKSKANNNSSLGLKNIAQRLHLLYGNRASLTIFSKEGIGTTVEIILPIESGEKR